jgi:transposase
MITQRAYRFRIYPNASQRQQLAVEFGNARFAFLVALVLF